MSHTKLLLWRLSLILCLAVFAVTAHAQFRAGIQGVVTDVAGALVPDATVTLTNIDTNISRIAKTSDGGVYAFTYLGPGTYKVTVEKAGFSKKILEEVRVSAEQTRSLNVQLEVGQVTESITVSALSVPLIDTQSAIIGGTITSQEIERLPSMARDPFTLVRLTPGAFGDGARSNSGGAANLPSVSRGGNAAQNSIFFEEAAPQVVTNGTRQGSMNIQIDGVGVNSVSWEGSAVVTPNEDSIKEMRVIANNYTAENGKNSGGQLLIISKGGTNEIHATAFFKFDRPGLNAFQKWNGMSSSTKVLTAVQRDTQRFNQLGFSVGAPVVKNKLFGFFSYETLRNASESLNNGWYETAWIRAHAPAGSIANRVMTAPGQTPWSDQPAPALKCADLPAIATQCQDIGTAGGLIDIGSPMILPLGTQDPTRGATATPYGIGSGLDGIADYQYLSSIRRVSNKGIQYNGRADYTPTDKDVFSFSVYWTPRSNTQVRSASRDIDKWAQATTSRSWTGIATHTFSPTMLNEARLGFSGWHFNEFTTNPDVLFGMGRLTVDGTGGVPGLTGPFGPQTPGWFDQATRNVRDTLTKVHNSHSLKFGAEYARARFLDVSPGNGLPGYTFRSIWNFMDDAPYQEGATFDPTTGKPTFQLKNLGYTNVGIFAQDDWKVRRNLTLNLGIRWEYFGPLREKDGLISNIILGTPGPNALTLLTVRKGGGLQQMSKTNFGPQVGFAWSPGSLAGRDLRNKLVLRGGFGIGFNPQKLATTSDQRNNPPFVINLNSQTLTDILYQLPTDFLCSTCFPINPVTIQTFSPTTGLPLLPAPVTGQFFSPGASSYNAFDRVLNTPTTYRFSMDAQYDLGHNWVATLGYQGSQTRNYSRRLPLNLFYYPNLNPTVRAVTWQANDALTHYNAMLAEVQHRFSTSFELDVQYRLARLIDQGSEDYYQDVYPFALNASTGPADYDVTHALQVWGVWTPTLFKGTHNWMEKAAGGWTISGIFNMHSGMPWTPTYNLQNAEQRDAVYTGSGYSGLRAQSYLGGMLNNFSNLQFMQPNGQFPLGALAYFTAPVVPTTATAPGAAGGGLPPYPLVGRNSFRGPRYRAMDAQLAKAFGLPKMKILGENAKLNIQLNAFNVFNNLNLNRTPQTRIAVDARTGVSDPNFGMVSGALGGRIVEVQARFSF